TRVQVGKQRTTAQQMSSALTDPPPTNAAASEWFGVAEQLDPGQKTSVSITVPTAELGLDTPGVYPILVNINGTRDYGGAARLPAVNFLIPVAPTRMSQGDRDGTSVSMLWPIAAMKPAVVMDPYDGPIVLSDDKLAAELAPGGRLDAL